MFTYSRGAIAIVTISAVLAVSSCSARSTGPDDPVPATTSSDHVSSTAPSTTTADSTTVDLSSDAWITNQTIANTCNNPGNAGYPVPGSRGADTDHTVFDVTSGTWLPVPLPRTDRAGEKSEHLECVITGDPKDPVVVYASTIVTSAQGRSGEKRRGEVYAIKVRGGSADDAVDLSSILTPGTGPDYIDFKSFPGGFFLGEVGIDVGGGRVAPGRGLKLVTLDDHLKPTVTNVFPFSPRNVNDIDGVDMSVNGDVTRVVLDKPDAVLKIGRLDWIRTTPRGSTPLPDNPSIYAAVGRFVVYRVSSTNGIVLMDTVSGKKITTPFKDSLPGDPRVWGSVVKIGNSWVVDMSTGTVLLDSTKETSPAKNALADHYLYVDDGADNPVIDLRTGRTVSKGWTVRPVGRIEGWTIVSHSGTLEPDRLELVKDTNGTYPGPWW
ncbi:hypothetical protein [Gordonia spumicola]|uniref:hypothetical protein n=1 Tax=Gordonia spumicola TaxID=589161 RepID=UPI0013798CB5|nr:hypothetical protein [Gordonia spumicola]